RRVNWAFFTPFFSRIPSPEQLCVWADRVNLFTLYGSAEQSVTSHGTAPLSLYGHSNEIGRPFPGNRSWIVDSTDGSRFVPVGAVGELVVEGPAVAREYMQDTDKTRGAFPAAFPWRPAFSGTPARFCWTGDLVKYGADGDTLDVGRRDGQIKLRGQRIELGEMEYLPSSVPALSVEILVPRGEKPDKAALAAFVALGDDYEGDDGIDVPSTTTRSPQPSQALYPRLRSAVASAITTLSSSTVTPSLLS
ncbi:AMP-dependent synthetase/ligase, partial [Macrophomina phaseolina MS6]